MGPGHCSIISSHAVPLQVWDPDTAPLSAQKLFLQSYGTRTLLHYQLTRCSSRVMGPGHCSIISSHAVPPELWDLDTAPLSAHKLFLLSYGTRTLLHYQIRGCSKLWDPDTAPLSAHKLFLLSYGTRTLLHYQIRGCSKLWDPDTAPLSGDCSMITEAVTYNSLPLESLHIIYCHCTRFHYTF